MEHSTAIGLALSKPEVRMSLLATGRFLTIFPASALRFPASRSEVKVLHVSSWYKREVSIRTSNVGWTEVGPNAGAAITTVFGPICHIGRPRKVVKVTS